MRLETRIFQVSAERLIKELGAATGTGPGGPLEAIGMQLVPVPGLLGGDPLDVPCEFRMGVDPPAGLPVITATDLSQVTLAVQFVELTEAESREMGFVWFQVLSILTESQYRIVQQPFEQSSRLRVIGTNRLTTVNGHRARIAVPSTDAINIYLDCLPTVRSPHQLELAAGLRAATAEGEESLQPGASVPSADQPRTESRAVLWTGQTMVIWRLASAALPQNADAMPQSRRHLFAFITPTIIDPIGIGPHLRHIFDPDTIPPQDLD